MKEWKRFRYRKMSPRANAQISHLLFPKLTPSGMWTFILRNNFAPND